MSSPRVIAEKRRGSYKTELCRAFLEGRKCPHDKECTFAHGCGELQERPRPSNYRTKICNKMLSSGDCPYGDKCNFDHDPVAVSRARVELDATLKRKQEQGQQQQYSAQEQQDARYLCRNVNIAAQSTNSAVLNALNIAKDKGQNQQSLPQIPPTGLPSPESLQECFETFGEIQQKIEERDSSYYSSSIDRDLFISSTTQTPQQAINSIESSFSGSSYSIRPANQLNTLGDISTITTSAALVPPSILVPLAGNHSHPYFENLAFASKLMKQEGNRSSSLDSAFSELPLHSPNH